MRAIGEDVRVYSRSRFRKAPRRDGDHPRVPCITSACVQAHACACIYVSFCFFCQMWVDMLQLDLQLNVHTQYVCMYVHIMYICTLYVYMYTLCVHVHCMHVCMYTVCTQNACTMFSLRTPHTQQHSMQTFAIPKYYECMHACCHLRVSSAHPCMHQYCSTCTCTCTCTLHHASSENS
jgi:hypothetical protein